jgi:hypothetical protein
VTSGAQRASKILDWAFEKPAERAAEGLRQVNELAAGETDERTLAVLQDAGTMLSRLKG